MSYQQAIQLIQSGHLMDARQLLVKLPMEFETLNLLGVIGQFTGDWESARDYWVKASAYAPENLDVRLNLGIACMALGLKDEAAIWWESILVLDDQHYQSLINLGLYHREREENQQAHLYWSRALQLVPENSNVQEWLADVKGVLGLDLMQQEQWIDAEEYLKDAVTLDPTEVKLWEHLADWHCHFQEYTLAMNALQNAIELEPEDKTLMRRYLNLLNLSSG